MNRMEHDLWVRAVNELCRACPFTACPGQENCTMPQPVYYDEKGAPDEQ